MRSPATAGISEGFFRCIFSSLTLRNTLPSHVHTFLWPWAAIAALYISTRLFVRFSARLIPLPFRCLFDRKTSIFFSSIAKRAIIGLDLLSILRPRRCDRVTSLVTSLTGRCSFSLLMKVLVVSSSFSSGTPLSIRLMFLSCCSLLSTVCSISLSFLLSNNFLRELPL